MLLLFILFSQCLCKTPLKMVSSLQSSDLIVEKEMFMMNKVKKSFISFGKVQWE